MKVLRETSVCTWVFRCAPLTAFVILATPLQAQGTFEIEPPQVVLNGAFARAQLLVRGIGMPSVELRPDLTGQAVYRSSRSEVAIVSPAGQVLARADGEAEVTITVNGVSRSVPVRVTGVGATPQVRFDEHILPIMSRAGCNSAACHASQYGQGDFKLSVFASDAHADHAAIVRPVFGRRVSLGQPDQSLVLLKPTGAVPHGGAVRLPRDSVDYQMFLAWITAGAPAPPPRNAVELTGLKIVPERRNSTTVFTQQLRVLAKYNSGEERDVTHWCRFDSMDEGVLEVSQQGLVKVHGKGQGTTLAKFQGRSAITQVIVPFGPPPELASWKENNFIDRIAAAKFRELGLTPAPLCDDATFLRRAHLHAIGAVPTVEEARRFLDANDPDKRRKLVDRLLGLTGDPNQDIYNNTYASWRTLQWADLLRNRGGDRQKQEMWALHNWLLASFRDNKRFDRMVRELITARGSTVSNGPANFHRIFDTADNRAEAVAQLFLGVRMQCAKCHHHPFETISQADYYGVSAFFARIGLKGLQDFGVRHYENDIVVLRKGDVRHPRTNEIMSPTPLHGRSVPDTGNDRRVALADWITSPNNPYFARSIVNRYWALCMGRGLVEPVDDMRGTNPPSNPELLDALAREFVRTGYDVKQLLRTIMTSRLYQLDSGAQRTPDIDGRFHASYQSRRMIAEPLFDAIDAATEAPIYIGGLPLGTRAIDLPDNVGDGLMLTFGKPLRESVCECERASEPSLDQALQMLNSDKVYNKVIYHKGRIQRLVGSKTPPHAVVEELYLAALSRRPTPAEQEACRRLLAEAPDPQSFYQDLLWSLLNSKQFLYVR